MGLQRVDGLMRGRVDEIGERYVATLRRNEDAVVGHLHRHDLAGALDQSLLGPWVGTAVAGIGVNAALPEYLRILPWLDLEAYAELSQLAAPDLLIGFRGQSLHLSGVALHRGENLVQELISDIDPSPEIDIAVGLGENHEPVAQAGVVVAEPRPGVEGVPPLLRRELIDEVPVVVRLLAVLLLHRGADLGQERGALEVDDLRGRIGIQRR